MSSAPTEMTCGTPCSPAAVSRSGPAERTPPTSSSASSVVVMSSTPAIEAVADEPLHRPAAGAGGVEDEHLVARRFENLARCLDAGRGDAEHGGGDNGLVFALELCILRLAAN